MSQISEKKWIFINPVNEKFLFKKLPNGDIKTVCYLGKGNLKQEILTDWLARATSKNMLWGVQAKDNYDIIKNNSIDDARKILQEQYKEFQNLGISSFIKEALEDIERLQIEVDYQ